QLSFISVAFLLFALLLLNVPAATVISTLSLHDALPICELRLTDLDITGDSSPASSGVCCPFCLFSSAWSSSGSGSTWSSLSTRRSEEHTSELQSRENLVCRLLLEKKNNF